VPENNGQLTQSRGESDHRRIVSGITMYGVTCSSVAIALIAHIKKGGKK